MSQQSAKIVSSYNCQRSACLWTDPHTSTCSKLTIMARCSKDSCDWYSLHRNYPFCDKLSFYCNCKKEREAVYKYYDSLPQVKDIPTKEEGSRDLSVKEQKYVVMRLLYRMVSNVVGDPRLSKSCYPLAKIFLPGVAGVRREVEEGGGRIMSSATGLGSA